MTEILIKAASFVAIIVVGYVLRRRGFLRKKIFMYCQKLY